MSVTTHRTHCRYCHAYCPMVADVEDGRVVAVRPDTENEMYGGYTCIKGRQLVEQMYQSQRLTSAQKRNPEGGFDSIASESALDEIAARIGAIIEKHGPRAVATYNGTYAFQNSAQLVVSRAFHDAIDSPSFYTSVTIDQPAKVFVSTRHGYWGAGGHYFNDADVAMVIGNNPMISQYAPPGGVPSVSPFHSLREARKRGLKLIAVDPRSTELTRRADYHLQIRPGEDATLLAGMIRVILAESLHDATFCAEHTDGLAQLEAAVAPFDLDYVAARTDIDRGLIVTAARCFAAGPRGSAITGTGPEMAPHANLSQQLVASLNTICGRYYREGEVLPNPGMLAPEVPRRAQALALPLAWGRGARSRIDDSLGELTTVGMMGPVTEMPAALLADEILNPGEGQVRALLCIGGNPLVALPDQEKAYAALQHLDLLVCIDPYLSATTQLADYVLAPKLTLEREDVTLLTDAWYEKPYSQYSRTVIESEHDVIEEWELYTGVARRLGIDLVVNGRNLGGESRPDKFEVLGAITRNSRMPLQTLRERPGGHVFDEVKVTVSPADPGMAAKLHLFPDGVAEEFAELLDSSPVDDGYSHRLICARSKYVLNSSGLNLSMLAERMGTTNPAYLHPEDMDELGLEEDSLVEVSSAHGKVPAVVRSNDRIKRGVVAMHHAWGGAPIEDNDRRVRELGVNTNRLVDNRSDTQRFTGMSRQSAIPVNIRPASR